MKKLLPIFLLFVCANSFAQLLPNRPSTRFGSCAMPVFVDYNLDKHKVQQFQPRLFNTASGYGYRDFLYPVSPFYYPVAPFYYPDSPFYNIPGLNNATLPMLYDLHSTSGLSWHVYIGGLYSFIYNYTPRYSLGSSVFDGY